MSLPQVSPPPSVNDNGFDRWMNEFYRRSSAIDNSFIGVGQTWQAFNVPQRNFGITYFNTTGRTITVSATGTSTSAAAWLQCSENGGTPNLGQGQGALAGNGLGGTWIISPGASYVINVNGGVGTFGSWFEKR